MYHTRPYSQNNCDINYIIDNMFVYVDVSNDAIVIRDK